MASLAAGGDASPVAAATAAAAAASISEMSPAIQAKYDCVRSVGEECVSESELKAVLIRKVGELGSTFNLYDGFEPSGRVHIAQGAFKANNVNKCTSSGGVFIFWVADW
jgi:tyrosyl-tRNA synthetase